MALSIKLKTTTVDVPDVGPVVIRQLSGTDLAQWLGVRKGVTEDDQSTALTAGAMLVALCLVQDDGTRHYDPSDLDPIRQLPADVLDSLVEACLVHNKLKAGDVVAEKKD